MSFWESGSALFFFPIAVDVPMERWPWANWALIAIIIGFFLMQVANPEMMTPLILGLDDAYEPVEIDLENPELTELLMLLVGSPPEESPLAWVGHMFLHGNLIHLAGNLIFMWVFGNAVCAKIGNLWYPVLWIGCGLVAAIAQRMVFGGGLIGASGAISGISGFFLVFYLRNDVAVFWLFLIRFGTFTLSSYWLILAYFALDLFALTNSESDGVAHLAHIGGTMAGFTLAVVLLRAGWLESGRSEHTLLDVFGGRTTDAAEPPDRRYASLIQRRLMVVGPGGDVQRVVAAELLHDGRAEGENARRLVSETGDDWLPLAEWLNRERSR